MMLGYAMLDRRPRIDGVIGGGNHSSAGELGVKTRCEHASGYGAFGPRGQMSGSGSWVWSVGFVITVSPAVKPEHPISTKPLIQIGLVARAGIEPATP